MIFLSHAVIYLRPKGAEYHTTGDMIKTAAKVASSADELLALTEELIAKALEAARPIERLAAGNSVTKDDATVPNHKKARFHAREGEYRRAGQTLKPAFVAPASRDDVQLQFAKLNPQTGAKAAGGVLIPTLPNWRCVQRWEKTRPTMGYRARPLLRSSCTTCNGSL